MAWVTGMSEGLKWHGVAGMAGGPGKGIGISGKTRGPRNGRGSRACQKAQEWQGPEERQGVAGRAGGSRNGTWVPGMRGGPRNGSGMIRMTGGSQEWQRDTRNDRGKQEWQGIPIMAGSPEWRGPANSRRFRGRAGVPAMAGGGGRSNGRRSQQLQWFSGMSQGP